MTVQYFPPKDAAQVQRWRYDFSNGRSASVIRGPWTYGGEDGLFEVLEFNSSDEPRGYLTLEKMLDYLQEIASKP